MNESLWIGKWMAVKVELHDNWRMRMRIENCSENMIEWMDLKVRLNEWLKKMAEEWGNKYKRIWIENEWMGKYGWMNIRRMRMGCERRWIGKQNGWESMIEWMALKVCLNELA